MRMRIVLVETEYGSNLGAVCRVAKNFGFGEIYAVNPKCGIGVDAYKGAKHAKDVLKKIRIVGSLDEAVEGCFFVAGTTGVKLRNKGTIRGIMPLREFAKGGRGKSGKIALVFGREGVGLNEEELNKCDILLNIETSAKYPVMNLSHAVAVALYALSSMRGGQKEKPANNRQINALKRMFSEFSSSFRDADRRAPVAFSRVLGRAKVNEFEANALLSVLRVAIREKKKTDGKIRK